jgi:hypothetical protein
VQYWFGLAGDKTCVHVATESSTVTLGDADAVQSVIEQLDQRGVRERALHASLTGALSTMATQQAKVKRASIATSKVCIVLSKLFDIQLKGFACAKICRDAGIANQASSLDLLRTPRMRLVVMNRPCAQLI